MRVWNSPSISFSCMLKSKHFFFCLFKIISKTLLNFREKISQYFWQINWNFFLNLNFFLSTYKDGNQIGQNNLNTNQQFVGIRTSDDIKYNNQLLPNGSLLITNVQKTDQGKFKIF